MRQSPRPPETRDEFLVALADQYVERHRAMENYIWAWYTTFNVLRRLDALSARVRELSEDEYQEMMRLKETHDIIRDSPNVLPLRSVGQLFSSLIIPTLAFFLAVAGEVLLGNLLESTLIQNLTSFGP